MGFGRILGGQNRRKNEIWCVSGDMMFETLILVEFGFTFNEIAGEKHITFWLSLVSFLMFFLTFETLKIVLPSRRELNFHKIVFSRSMENDAESRGKKAWILMWTWGSNHVKNHIKNHIKIYIDFWSIFWSQNTPQNRHFRGFSVFLKPRRRFEASWKSNQCQQGRSEGVSVEHVVDVVERFFVEHEASTFVVFWAF